MFCGGGGTSRGRLKALKRFGSCDIARRELGDARGRFLCVSRAVRCVWGGVFVCILARSGGHNVMQCNGGQ